MNHKQLHAVFVLSKPTDYNPNKVNGEPTWSHSDKDGVYVFAYHSFKGYYCDVYPPGDTAKNETSTRVYLNIREGETTGDNHET